MSDFCSNGDLPPHPKGSEPTRCRVCNFWAWEAISPIDLLDTDSELQTDPEDSDYFLNNDFNLDEAEEW